MAAMVRLKPDTTALLRLVRLKPDTTTKLHMRLTIEHARGLVDRAMKAVGYEADEAATIADHLLDCELRGVTYGGLARAVSIVERTIRAGVSRLPIRIVKDTPVSAS